MLADLCGGDVEKKWIDTASSISFRAVWGDNPEVYEKTKETISSKKRKYLAIISADDLSFCKRALKFGSLLGLPFRDRFDKPAYDAGMYSSTSFFSEKMLEYVYTIAALMNSKIDSRKVQDQKG